MQESSDQRHSCRKKKAQHWVLLNTQIDASLFPYSSVLQPVTRKPNELSHLEGHLSSLSLCGGEEGGVRKSWARVHRCLLPLHPKGVELSTKEGAKKGSEDAQIRNESHTLCVSERNE